MSAESLWLSVLDLAPVSSGSSSAEALRNTLELARRTDTLGYTRYWLSEHHNTGLLACSAPEILIGQVAAVTQNLRVGSGGIMLPNHAALKVAETFRTLTALFPGRIDLGIGRAPGTDPFTAMALRRFHEGASRPEELPGQMEELLGFFNNAFPVGHRYARIAAIPSDAPTPELWLLGSSDFSARLAAELGLSFAFAHHINPEPARYALRAYHEFFRPSEYLDAPRALVAVAAVCAPTDAEADVLARPGDLARLRLYRGQTGPLPSVQEATEYPYTPEEQGEVIMNRERVFVGSPETLRSRLSRFAVELGVGEVMITSLIHDHADRVRSYELLAPSPA